MLSSILTVALLAAHANAQYGNPTHTVTVTEYQTRTEILFTGKEPASSTSIPTVVSGLNNPEQSTTLSAYGVTASSSVASTSSTSIPTVVSGLNNPDETSTLSAYGATPYSSEMSTSTSIPTVVSGLNNPGQSTTLSAYGVTPSHSTTSICEKFPAIAITSTIIISVLTADAKYCTPSSYTVPPHTSSKPAPYSIFGGRPIPAPSSKPATTIAPYSYNIFGGNPYRSNIDSSSRSTLATKSSTTPHTTKTVTSTAHSSTKTHYSTWPPYGWYGW